MFVVKISKAMLAVSRDCIPWVGALGLPQGLTQAASPRDELQVETANHAASMLLWGKGTNPES